jgi:hypothetical protein
MKLNEKIKHLLQEYLRQIEKYSFYMQAFRNPALIIGDTAVALKIPLSHMHFIIKFHFN